MLYLDEAARAGSAGGARGDLHGPARGDALEHFPWAWKESASGRAFGGDRGLARAAPAVAADPRPRDRQDPKCVGGARDRHVRDPGPRAARRGARRPTSCGSTTGRCSSRSRGTAATRRASPTRAETGSCVVCQHGVGVRNGWPRWDERSGACRTVTAAWRSATTTSAARLRDLPGS